ncbi:MAG: MMPL family transporter [Gammaproteobacteria bacterium]|nr:MMPL family transporter [Gammaproteobacteria bacterium]
MNTLLTALYERLVLRTPWLALALLGLVMAAITPGLKNFKLDASTDALLLENDDELRAFSQMALRYKMRDFLFVAVVPKEDLFTRDSLALISQLRDEISQVSAVKDVITVLDVPLLSTVTGPMSELGLNFSTLRSRDVKVEAARRELTESPLYKNLVSSADGKVGAMQIFLEEVPDLARLTELRDDLLYKRNHGGLTAPQERELQRLRPDYERAKEANEAQAREAIAAIRQVLDKHRAAGVEIHLGGMPMIIDDMMTFIQSDLAVFGSAVLAFLVVMLGLIFREVRWVALPFASCLYASVAMFSLLGLVGWKVTIISSNFVSLMLILTMSMNIHLVVRYRELLRDHPDLDQLELTRRTVAAMARPSLYTVLTNIIGFGSFVLCDIKPVIDFGWMMSIGLLVAFATTFTLFPALLALTRRRPLTRPEGEGYAFTAALARLTEKHGTAVLVASLVIAVLAALGARRLTVENSFVSYFHSDTEIHRGLTLIDQRLGGTTPIDVLLEFPRLEQQASQAGMGDLAAMFDQVESAEQAPDTWFTPARLARIEAVHSYLESLPEVGKVLSLASTLRVAEGLNQGKPLTPQEVDRIYKEMPEAAKVNLLSPYVSVYDNEARLTARIVDTAPGLNRNELVHRIQHDLEAKLKLKPDEFRVTGLMVLYNNVLQSLYESQILTFGSALAMIMVPLVIMFRSLSVALIGLLPNVLGALVILGFMGWAGIPLDIMTITIASITIGIAVEDCIHYLYSYKVEYQRLRDPLATLHYCHNNVAKAGFYTTVTVVVGFSILMLSNFIPTILFGLLTALAMSVALLGALTLMPKLVLWWKPFKLEEEW